MARGRSRVKQRLLFHRWSKPEGEGNWIGGSTSGGTGSQNSPGHTQDSSVLSVPTTTSVSVKQTGYDGTEYTGECKELIRKIGTDAQ